MLRLIFLPLLLFTISISCMGQTFQYSRGWTNGKRTPNVGSAALTHFRRDEDALPEIFDLQENERRLEKCLLQIEHFIRNPLQLRTTTTKYAATALNPGGGSNNNNNNLYHHPSNELFEDLGAVVEPSDYLKH